jgi:hypothetical protein
VTAEAPMGGSASAAAGARAEGAAAAPRAVPARPFSTALATARAAARRGVAQAGGGASRASPGSSLARALARSRLGADRAALTLRARRDEAEPSASAARPATTRELGPPLQVEAVQRLFPPAALEGVALALAREPGRPTVNVRLADGSGIRLTRGAAGIELVLEVRPEARRAAEAELPAIGAALRARGVHLASAAVRATPRSAGCSAGERALTGRRPSDTTASPSGGTVAKW